MGLFDKFKKKKAEGEWVDVTQEQANERIDKEIYKDSKPVREADDVLRQKANETAQAKAEFEQTLKEAKEAQVATEARIEPQPASQPQPQKSKDEKEFDKRKAKLDLAKQKAEVEAIKAKSEALQGSRYSAGAKRFVGVVKGISTMGGKVRVRPETKRYYIPKPPADAYVPTGMRSLTKPVMGQTLHTTSLRKAGTPNFQALRQSTTPTRMGQTSRPPAFGSQPVARPSMNIANSPIGKMAIGSASSKAMLTGGSNQSQAMARLRELQMPRGLNRNEKTALQGIAESGHGSKLQLLDELVNRGMSRTEANMAVDGLIRKGAVAKTQTPSGEQVLEVR